MVRVNRNLRGSFGRAQQRDARLLTAKEAAAFLGFTWETLKYWRSERRGPSYFRFGGRKARVRYRRSDLETFLESRRIRTSGK